MNCGVDTKDAGRRSSSLVVHEEEGWQSKQQRKFIGTLQPILGVAEKNSLEALPGWQFAKHRQASWPDMFVWLEAWGGYYPGKIDVSAVENFTNLDKS